MTTARDIVTDAMYACGALGKGEALDANDAQMVLRRFSRMLSAWQTERLSVYELYDDTLTLSGASSYSSTSLASGLRPVEIVAARVTAGGVDYPVAIVDAETYAGILQKATTGTFPYVLYMRPAMPVSVLYFYPVSPSGTLTLTVHRPLLASTFTLDTAIGYPSGYERALVANLAVDTCKPLTGMPADGGMRDDAIKSKAVIWRANRTPMMPVDSGLPFGSSVYDITLE